MLPSKSTKHRRVGNRAVCVAATERPSTSRYFFFCWEVKRLRPPCLIYSYSNKCQSRCCWRLSGGVDVDGVRSVRLPSYLCLRIQQYCSLQHIDSMPTADRRTPISRTTASPTCSPSAPEPSAAAGLECRHRLRVSARKLAAIAVSLHRTSRSTAPAAPTLHLELDRARSRTHCAASDLALCILLFLGRYAAQGVCCSCKKKGGTVFSCTYPNYLFFWPPPPSSIFFWSTSTGQARRRLARLPIMGNPVSKSQEFMEQRERTNTEYRKQGTLSMNLVRTRSASSLHHPPPPLFFFVCRERSLK